MDEVNKSGPYYEAVSLCYFNGNDSGWSWTRVADIENGELTTFLYNPDEPYFYENRNFLIDKTGKVHTKGDLAVFAWSDSPNASGSDKPFNDATELKDFPIHVFKLSAKNTLQVIDNLRNGVSCGSASHDVMYIFCESDEGFQGVLCPAQSMEERNQQYFLKDSVSKLPYYLLKSSDILSIYELKNLFGNEKCVFLKALVPGTPISYLPTRETSAVVDKATYQIGGFYYPGSERRKDTRTRPARAFIDDENYKKRVVSCDECGWFGLREDDIKVCPFCGNRSLTESLPMLRPWGFAPKDAKEIPVADLDEQYSYVQQPLYSTLPESETMENVAGYKSLRMASRTNQRIIMVNKGAGGKGFMVCPDCGAAMPGDDPSVLEKVDRPYITVPKFKCSHRDAENLNLGYDFVTDMLVLEISLDPNKVETDREDNLWVNRAGQSLAETIRLVVSRILDVEFTELMTGYRVRKNQTGAYIDVYIYDSLSSGAGYAVAVASVMPEVLERAEALLQGCDCENACYNCLKHYRNQNVHGMLDRFAALDLLNWAKDNSLAPMLSIDMQKKLLAPLGNVLKYADIILSANGDELSVKKNLFHKALKIYPAMWKKPEAKDTIYISDACVKYAKPSAVKKIIDGL